MEDVERLEKVTDSGSKSVAQVINRAKTSCVDRRGFCKLNTANEPHDMPAKKISTGGELPTVCFHYQWVTSAYL